MHTLGDMAGPLVFLYLGFLTVIYIIAALYEMATDEDADTSGPGGCLEFLVKFAGMIWAVLVMVGLNIFISLVVTLVSYASESFAILLALGVISLATYIAIAAWKGTKSGKA